MTQPSNESGMTFTCSACGAKLAYDATAQAMRCPYCSRTEAVAATSPDQSAQALREIPIEEGFARAQRGLGTAVTNLQCKDCGATVNVAEGQQTAKCSFCGSHQVLQQPADPNLIRPESLVPFKVDKPRSQELFSKWVRSLWFRPSNLKHLAKVQAIDGVYVPFWTFDTWIDSRWTAERGWHYTETEYYTAEENGETVQRSREVQRTRWEPASGWRRDFFDDIVVCASRGLPVKLVDKFSSFNTKELTAYQPHYLSGWRAESYAIDLMPAWQQAQQKAAAAQETRCSGDVGGNTHRNLQVMNSFSAVTFKHVLLPIWVAAYRYQAKSYQFLVNGQTGEVVGEAPWSVIKIVAFIVLILAIVAGAVVGWNIWMTPSAPGKPKSGIPTATATATVPPRLPTPPPRETAPPPGKLPKGGIR